MSATDETFPDTIHTSPSASSQPARPATPPPPATPRVAIWPAAIGAGLAAMIAALLVRFVFGILSPAEIFGDRFTALLPLPIFARLLTLFGPSTKHIYYGALLLGQGALTALLAVAYWRLRAWLRSRPPMRPRAALADALPSYVEAPLLALLPWLLSAGILAPLIGGGFFGANLEGGVAGVFVSALLPDLAFALAFVTLLRRNAGTALLGDASSARGISRRRLLRQVGFGLAVVAGAAVAWDFITSGVGSVLGVSSPRRPPLDLSNIGPDRIVPPPQPIYGTWSDVAGLAPEVTAAQDFYYVSKNLAGDPGIDVASWHLAISGRVDRPYSLTYDALRNLPRVERYHTLECISNEVGGDLISNSLFTGVSLADLLNHAGIQSGASELIFHAADGYADTLHLAQALDPRALVVYLINGEKLPQPHGYPARLLVPGLYGMKNGKWLTELELGSGGFTGYWEERGWTREAIVKTMTRIDTPHNNDLIAQRPTFVAGVAYAGERGIARVDVTTDGGKTWQPATLRRPLGNLTWVLWELPWTPSASGTYILGARSVDGTGNVQTPDLAPTLPDGASGYDSVAVHVG
ncbi:MAG TPA: molybdopterin-dependent oxidoreductase [Ktedonobacterales bacterium]|nr:molybdopterin-dependent oxidoreductase [Ktedonobacterales bacterium]